MCWLNAYPMVSRYISSGVQFQFSKFAAVSPAIIIKIMAIMFMTVRILLTEVNSFTPKAIKAEKCTKGHELFFSLSYNIKLLSVLLRIEHQ